MLKSEDLRNLVKMIERGVMLPMLLLQVSDLLTRIVKDYK